MHVRTQCRLVALTFDDGPDPRTTPGLLRVLRSAGAHATFFDVGRAVLARPDLVRAEVRAGDEVGDHTFDHAALPRLDGAALAAEFTRSRAALRATGVDPHLFRPPHGYFDGRVASAALARGERLIGWDLVVVPGSGRRSSAAAAAAARPGSIILSHDYEAAVARPLLRGLSARGLQAVTVSELLAAGAAPGGCSPGHRSG